RSAGTIAACKKATSRSSRQPTGEDRPASRSAARNCSCWSDSASTRKKTRSPSCAARVAPGAKSPPDWAVRPRHAVCNWRGRWAWSPARFDLTRMTLADTTAIKTPAEQLSRLWHNGQGPDVGAFLGRFPALAPVEAVEVLAVDQRKRWLAGEKV